MDTSIPDFIEMVVTLFAAATTRYILEDDRLVIRRGGFISMEIPYRDVDLIEYIDDKPQFFGPERLYRLAFPLRNILRIQIRKKSSFHYVLINPRDPDYLIKTWYWARYPAEARAQAAQPPLPSAPRLV
ncbi:PH domain-containing protein [Bradyrhizobium sp. SYSU BS000235]|uniref:PH domain-containing protein n=1 Tax=Bradyrhizobium sp. SYSU BS000235 TaxID=3411332 RepID=UPI003C735105